MNKLKLIICLSIVGIIFSNYALTNLTNSDYDTKKESTSIKVDSVIAYKLFTDKYTPAEIEQITKRKSSLQTGITEDSTLPVYVYEAPSSDSSVIDTLLPHSKVKISESTECWFKIFYNNGKSGYVLKKHIIESDDSCI